MATRNNETLLGEYDCPECEGLGRVDQIFDGDNSRLVECIDCRGTGMRPYCPYCDYVVCRCAVIQTEVAHA